MKPDKHPEDRKSADEFSVYIPERARRPGWGARKVLFAGVAGACLLGVGLGLWARPAMNERQMAANPPADAAQAPKPAPAARKLEIVVDNRPAPLGAPIDVLPQADTSQAATPAPVMPPPLVAPSRPPQGLMKVQDVITPEPPSAPPPAPTPAPRAERPAAETQAGPALIKAHPVRDLAALVVAALASKSEPPQEKLAAKPAAEPAATHAHKAAPASKGVVPKSKAVPQKVEGPVRLAKAAPAQKPDHRAELSHAAAAKAAAHKLELAQAADAARQAAHDARAEKAEKQQTLRLAKAQALEQKHEQARLALAHKQEQDRQVKAARQQQIRLAKAEAKAEAKGRAEAHAEALAQAKADALNKARLASLVHAVKRAMASEARAHAAPPMPSAAQLARLDRRHAKGRHEPQVEQAALKSHKPPRAAEAAPRPHVVQVPPPPRASGLMTVSAPRCANRDPGEALVCADPALGAADRQLNRAYEGARAAGVPDAQLQRQQQRWLAARSAAAREAPWAVHDVYLARIAELNSQARDANPND